MSTVTPSLDPRLEVIERLQAIVGERLTVTTSLEFPAGDRDAQGKLIVAWSDGSFDCGYIDTRKPFPEQQLAAELRRIAKAYTAMARKLEAKRPLIFRNAETRGERQEQRGVVVLEQDDCREIVYTHSLSLCQRWVKRWNKDDCGTPAVAIPIVQSVEGRKLDTIPTASVEGGDA